jgi:hypothetical protein
MIADLVVLGLFVLLCFALFPVLTR